MKQTVFITGASSGIGKATAKRFKAEGWNVVATMRNTQDGADLKGDRVLVTKLDLLDSETIKSAVQQTIEHFGKIDVLINNAGYGAYGPLEATPMDVLRRQFDVNLFGLAEVIKEVLPIMRENKSGTIVNVSSIGGRMTFPFGSLYHGSKWAVEGLSEALHFEVRLFGGRVKIIEPGGVNTDFSGRSFVFSNDENLEEYQPLVGAFIEAMSNMDTSRNQNPEEVANVIWEAATDDSDQLRYISGSDARATLESRYSSDTDEQFVEYMRKSYGL
ncbi:SDR family oxidoreductase [Exiguobacterium sp. CH10]|uniref:SDR family oxidoreductase n=1 Tax=Exiguobacterium sp. CH10 TaxID=2751261 RepID=UPI001BE95136|nr:SDR family oxidoreductase [Exiguobacterium sp. CH10]